ncbi:hypothetical protein ACOJTA_05665 [Malaciobacter sp. WC5094]
MNLNVTDYDFYENLKEEVFNAIDSYEWICEVKKSKMKCVLKHFFDVKDFNDFGSYEFTMNEFDEYYRNHHIKYTSESDFKQLLWSITDDN